MFKAAPLFLNDTLA
jgi:hypothetical protein